MRAAADGRDVNGINGYVGAVEAKRESEKERLLEAMKCSESLQKEIMGKLRVDYTWNHEIWPKFEHIFELS